MIFLDGETFPSILGTGTQDYFGAVWGYLAGQHGTPYHGVSLAGGAATRSGQYSSKWTMYRFRFEDPIRFEKSIRVTIETGHANLQANDYSLAGYWYQTEPHATLPALLLVKQGLPIPDHEGLRRYWSVW